MKKAIDKIKNNKVLYFLSILIIGLLIILVARITYAYLAPRISSALGNVTIDSDTVDDLDFIIGDPLNIDATSTTLPENGTNIVSSSVSSASLTANSTKNTAEYNYYLYFQILSNNFTYSNGSTPEIILTITDPNGDEVTNVSGLNYGTFSGVSGFDVTTKKGLFTIADGYTITSNSSTSATIQNWTFTLTYLNLSFDQSANYGHNLTTKVIMSRSERSMVLASYIKKLYTGTQGKNSIYYHDSSLANGAGDNSYRYAGASDSVNNFVCFGSNADTCPNNNLYRIIGVFDDQVKLIKYDYATKDMLGTDGGYYFDEEEASNENFYGKSKGNNSLNDVLGYQRKNTTSWSSSTLNTINLNTNYVIYLGTDWASKIATHTWVVGGNTSNNIYDVPVATTYKNEIVNPASNITYDAKIGLMYVSDFGFAASQNMWTSNLINYIISNNSDLNWMYMGLNENTITFYYDELRPFSLTILPVNSIMKYDEFITLIKELGGDISTPIRPVFYLNNDVKLASGTGTKQDPYRLEI